MTGSPHDPELADDLIGVASARLLAAGVPRGDRLRALRLLSILATLADTEGRVGRPLSMVASEFDLPADEVGPWLDHLLAVAAVAMEGDAIVLASREPARHVRMSLHDFLDAAAELDEAPTPARRLRPALLPRPSGSFLAAAAALVALALVGTTAFGDRSTPISRDRELDPPPVATTTSDPSPTGHPPEPAAPTERAEPPTIGERVGPVVVSTTTTTSLLPCPVGAPILEVLGTTTGADGYLAVDGVAHNPSSEALTIEAFTLRTAIAGEEVAAPGTDRVLEVPAHARVLWQSRIPVIAPAGTPVDVRLGNWEWRDLDAAHPCPSP